MGKTKTIISGIAWTIINNIVSILYGIVSVPFLINYFGKEEYGLIGIALSVNVYVQLLDMGMTNSNIRFFSEFIAKKEEDNVQKLFSLTHSFYFILGILNSVILFGLSFFVEDLFKITSEQGVILTNLFIILALNATFSWISICFDQFIRANELIDWIKKRSSFLKIMQFLILASTIIFKLSIEFYFFGYIFVATLILPITIVKVRKINSTLKLNFSFDSEMFKTVYPYALSIFSFSIFQFTAFNLRPLLLGGISGPGAVAEFNIMMTITLVVTILSGSFMQVLLPIITKMTVNLDWKNINKIINDGTKYVSILLSFIIFLLMISIKELLILYVGVEYVKLSNWMIIWLLTLLLSHRNVMTSLVFTEKKLKSVVYMGAMAMILSIVAYIIFIPKYGVGGVVIGFIIHELIHTLFYYIYFLPYKFQINTKQVFFQSVFPTWIVLGAAFIVVTLASSFIVYSVWTTVVLKILLLGLFMLTLIWVVLLNKKDKQLLSSIVRKYNIK